MRTALNKCITLRVTSKKTHETTFNDHDLVDRAYVSWYTRARDLGVLVGKNYNLISTYQT
jgi:hypothetical protein